jgi:RNAse (barnase) inhibitor barstar
MDRQTLIIDSNNFFDLESFFDEIDRVLTKGLTWKTGHNMNAYNDLLRGGFGVYEYEEPVKIVWVNFSKSESILGKELTNDLKEYITDHKHIEFVAEG